MQAFAKTDIGRVRTGNQDYYFYTTEPIGRLSNLFLVADGMGGHNAGDFASRFCVEAMVKYIQKSKEGNPAALFRKAMEETNKELLEVSSKDAELSGTGTTMVAATVDKDGILYTANIGDSRLYVIGENIHQVTKDHSYVNRMVELGRMVKDSPEYLKQKNYITRALGIAGAQADIFETKLQENDKILMCSDGLTNMVPDERICSLMRQEMPLKDRVTRLVEEANQNGGRDNISVLAVETGEKQEELC